LDSSLARIGGAIAAKIKATGINARTCMIIEGGRLCHTLINLSWPKDSTKTKKRIEKDITHKFGVLGMDAGVKSGTETGRVHNPGAEEIEWYAFTPTAVFGVAQDYDLRNANVDGLYQVYKETEVNELGRIVLGTRGKQTFYVWQKYLTSKQTMQALVKRVQGHVGRMKSSFLPGLRAMEAKGFPHKDVPGYVTAHEGSMCKGSVNDMTDNPNPCVEIISNATGVGNEGMRDVARRAMEVRADAIPKRMMYIAKHPELAYQEVI
jgi:hypothetical protein